MKNSFGRLRTEDEIRKQPDFRFYPAKVQQQWLDFYKKNRFINTVPPLSTLDQTARATHQGNIRRSADHDRSDTPEFLWLYGFGMHHELKALKDAGLRITRSRLLRKTRQCSSGRSQSRHDRERKEPTSYC